MAMLLLSGTIKNDTRRRIISLVRSLGKMNILYFGLVIVAVLIVGGIFPSIAVFLTALSLASVYFLFKNM